MDRTTVEFTLPESKVKCILYDLLSHGDYRAIQNKIADQIKLNLKGSSQEDVEVRELSGSVALIEDDLLVKLLLKEAIYESGETIVDHDSFVYNLSMRDGKALYSKCKEIASNSEIKPEDKKK